jgi:hypothetical protein
MSLHPEQALHPEQMRALAYARKRGTEAPLHAIRARVAATYGELEELAAKIPAEVAREHRSTSLWSIQEVIDHLVESDRPAATQLTQLLAGHDVDQPIPASLQSAEPLATDWLLLQQQLRNVHENVLDVLGAASDASPLTATAAVQMVVKCAGADGALTPVSWVARFDWKAFAILLHAHNREHIAQIQRILAAPAAGPAAGPAAEPAPEPPPAG